MARNLGRWSRSRPIVAAASAACLVLAIWLAATFTSRLLAERSFAIGVERLNHISESDRSCVKWTFAFRGRQVTVTARLGAEELERTESLVTERVFRADPWIRSRYVADVVLAQSKSRFIELLAADIRSIGDELDLDDDGRLELAVAAVQSIPYGEVRREIRLPIEVVAYRSGVCTEKTLLLAALMTHEGWDTCVWVFDHQRHAGVGVAADALGFHGTDYAFIETTGPGFIGQADPTYRSRGPIARPPQLIQVGEGGRRYGAGDRVAYILGVLDLAERGTLRLRSYDELAEGAPAELGARYSQVATVHERASGLVAYIRDNAHDRPGVYRTLRQNRSVDDINECLSWIGMPGGPSR